MSTPETSMREELEKAFDEAEEKEEAETGESKEDAPESVGAPETEGEGGEPVVEEVTADAETEGEEAAPETEAGVLEAEPDPKPDPYDVEPDSPLLKAPQSWRPAIREEWGNLPNSVREEVHRRERDFSMRMQNVAEDSKYGEAMQQILKPYESVMAMESSTPFQAVSSLARTAATLRMGTPVEKAGMIKHLINSYSVDIETLDKLLVDEEPQTKESLAMQTMLDSRLKPFEAMMGEIQQDRTSYREESGAASDKEVADFEKTSPEFLSDVREDMADLIDLKFARGEELTLKDAYDMAVNMRPDLRKIVTTRTNAQKIADKSKAAVGLKPSTPAPAADDIGDGTIRGALLAAWDQQEV